MAFEVIQYHRVGAGIATASEVALQDIGATALAALHTGALDNVALTIGYGEGSAAIVDLAYVGRELSGLEAHTVVKDFNW